MTFYEQMVPHFLLCWKKTRPQMHQFMERCCKRGITPLDTLA